jgi:hypothetical protein
VSPNAPWGRGRRSPSRYLGGPHPDEAALSSSEPPDPPASIEAGGSGTPDEPPPPPPPRGQDGTSEEPPPPVPSDAAPGSPTHSWGSAEAARPPRRRRLLVGIAVAVVVLAVPLALAVVAALSTPTEDESAQTATGDDEAPPAEVEPEPPDFDSLSGRDAVLARLLEDVDTSERAMIDFQDRLVEVLDEPDGEPRELLAQVREAAETSGATLGEVRADLVRPLDDRRVEEVRVAYLAHHDAWADYLDAVAEDPAVLGAESQDSRWQLSINLSAEVFARELRAVVDDDLDASVRTYARDILARGFERPDSVPDV